MKLVDSPNPDYLETGGPSEKRPPWWRRHVLQLTLVGLNVLLALFIGALLLSQPALLRPTGALKGQIVNGQGGPLPQAQIFVISAERWAAVDGQGRFLMDRVPVGQTAVMIVSTSPDKPPTGPPLSGMVTIVAGQTLDLGTVSLSNAP